MFTGILAITTVGVVWYARQQIKEAREVVQTELKDRNEADRIQHLLTLVGQFDQEPMATYRRRLAEKRLKPRDNDPFELYRVLDFFDTVGRLVDRGYLSDEDVWDQFGY